ncbi:MAG: hypothetical protein DI604_31170 [Delftia acidovorans]|nr:MAG: hypothetical protein DI604_31170 [Delftia acidovorans]
MITYREQWFDGLPVSQLVKQEVSQKYAAANDNLPDPRPGFGNVVAEVLLYPAQSADGRNGDFIQTYTGRKFWPMDPRADEVFIEDIAHALALQCRYAGHCLRFYSVAEHSVLMARHLLTTHGRTAAIYALLHDASEAYLVDVPRPVKPHLLGYAEAEGRVSDAVFARFRLTPALPQSVKDADNAILANEIENMMPMDWQKRLPPKLDTNLHYWTPGRAEVEFLATFEALMCGRAAA